MVHPGRPPAIELGKLLAGWAEEHGIELRTLVSERGCVGDDVPCVEEADFAPGLDLVVALGGDGTLLRALGLVLTEQVPALGVNAGRLGFLAEVEPSGFSDALAAVWAGRYRVERRTTLVARVLVDGQVTAEDLAINDVVLEKAARELAECIVEHKLQRPWCGETCSNLGQHRDKDNCEPAPIGPKQPNHQACHLLAPSHKCLI